MKRFLLIPLLIVALVGCTALSAGPSDAEPGPGAPPAGGPGAGPQNGGTDPGLQNGGAQDGGQGAGNGAGDHPGSGSAGGPDDASGSSPGSGAGTGGGDGTVTITFVGDIMLDRLPGEHLARGEDPFAGVADALTGADLTVGNLECVVSTVGEPVPKWFNFRCHPRVVPVLARYFDAVSVANNHSGDYGKEAFAEQLRLLTEGGVPYFGGGMNDEEAHRPLILERNGLRIALLGYNNVELRSYAAGPDTPGLAWIELDRLAADVRAARAEADIVVVYPHWGYDYMFWHAEDQAEIARVAIDNGADLVVGNHPHVTQPVEIYKDRLIAYSLGNFVFDDFVDVGPDLDEPSRTSWVLTVTIGKDGIRRWETRVARTDDRGFPQWLEGVASPCSDGAPEDGYMCYP
ncbi:CapA family protein [Symbiobacterium thermophilum]|uniref:CapA family protein n=1 Tax=Symbiobacterium thermophilum TaxID=2734 RepID=UPI0035C71638